MDRATGEGPGERANLAVSNKRFFAAQFVLWKQVAIGLWAVGAVAWCSIVVLGTYRFRRTSCSVPERPETSRLEYAKPRRAWACDISRRLRWYRGVWAPWSGPP